MKSGKFQKKSVVPLVFFEFAFWFREKVCSLYPARSLFYLKNDELETFLGQKLETFLKTRVADYPLNKNA